MSHVALTESTHCGEERMSLRAQPVDYGNHWNMSWRSAKLLFTPEVKGNIHKGA